MFCQKQNKDWNLLATRQYVLVNPASALVTSTVGMRSDFPLKIENIMY